MPNGSLRPGEKYAACRFKATAEAAHNQDKVIAFARPRLEALAARENRTPDWSRTVISVMPNLSNLTECSVLVKVPTVAAKASSAVTS